MELSTAGLIELASHEGIVLSPYKDSVGVYTIGIGHTAAAGAPDPAKLPKGVEQPLADMLALFRRDAARYAAAVSKAVKVPLKQHEFDALVSFHYNTGAIAKASLVKRLNAGDRAGAAAGLDAWHRPPEIISRRDREKRLFLTGNYESQGVANVYPADKQGRVAWSKGRRVDLTKALARSEASIVDPPFLPPPEPPIVVMPAGTAGPIPDDHGPSTAPWAETPPRGPAWARMAFAAAVLVVALTLVWFWMN